MDREDAVYVCNGIFLCHKNKEMLPLQQRGWTWRALCSVRYVSQRKTGIIGSHLYLESKKHNKQTTLEIINTENIFIVPGGVGPGAG